MIRAIPSLMVARFAEAVFSPDQISGLKLWLKADSLALTDNDPVSTWTDQSGNGNDLSGSGGARPTYKTNIQNGLPAVRFDGTDDRLDRTFTITYGTVFVVCNFNSGGNFPNYNGLFITNGGAAAEDSVIAGNGSGTTNIYFTAATPFQNDFIWINTVQTIDFALLATIKLISGVYHTPTSKTSLTIGNDPAAGSRFWNGDVLEVIVYDTALSSTDRGRVESYLNSKYALY